MSISKRVEDEMNRVDPLDDPYYDELWPSEQECAEDAENKRYAAGEPFGSEGEE